MKASLEYVVFFIDLEVAQRVPEEAKTRISLQRGFKIVLFRDFISNAFLKGFWDAFWKLWGEKMGSRTQKKRIENHLEKRVPPSTQMTLYLPGPGLPGGPSRVRVF